MATAEKKKKKTGPRAGNSVPTPVPAKSKKSTSALDCFTDILKAEEVTEQKKLELRRVKIMGEKQVEIESTKAKASVQIRREELKAQYVMEKLRLEHQMRLAELKAHNHSDRLPASGFHNTAIPQHHDYRHHGPVASTSYPSSSTSGYPQRHMPANAPYQLAAPNSFNFQTNDTNPPLSPDISNIQGHHTVESGDVVGADDVDPFAFTPITFDHIDSTN
jgi:hypothetical protein